MAGALLALVLLALARPVAQAAPSAPPAEQVRANRVVLTVRRDGPLHVHEAITYDFGTARDRHGLVRDIPYRTGRRTYGLEHLTASSPDAPARTELTRDGGTWTVRVGTAGSTVTGVHTYLLDYDVRYALTRRVRRFVPPPLERTRGGSVVPRRAADPCRTSPSSCCT
ncbi:DUF2207 domain-containing protein [Streptomyces sp. NPDC021224]|uniref:DUF2207 domain-containing protein n=1 Tax=unclassified Streptomyces TaxID=2593676 RepID=UPI0037A44A82